MIVERVLGGLGVGFGVLLLTVLIPRHVTEMPGFVNPALLPQVAGWLFILLGAIQCLARVRTAKPADPVELARLGVTVACVAAAIWLMPRLGYPLSAIALAAALCGLTFERRVGWLLVSVGAVPIGVWLVFEQVLGRPLPDMSLF